MKTSIMVECKHEYRTMPAHDPDHKLPCYCPCCMDSVMWANGCVMTTREYNSYYDENGNLKDANNDPAANNIVDLTND